MIMCQQNSSYPNIVEANDSFNIFNLAKLKSSQLISAYTCLTLGFFINGQHKGTLRDLIKRGMTSTTIFASTSD